MSAAAARRSQKPRITNKQFNPRIPVSEIIGFCNPEERDIARMLSKTWSEDELRSRQLFFFTLCSVDPELPYIGEFHNNIDYKKRWVEVEKNIAKNKPFDPIESLSKSEVLEKFNNEYTVSLVGTFDHPDEGIVQLFQDTVLATTDRRGALCFDLEFDEDDEDDEDGLPVVRGSCTLQIWIERNLDHKVGLFGTHADIFDEFEGFTSEGTLDQMEREVADGFHGGYWGFYDDEESRDQEEYNWYNRDRHEFGTESFMYAFQPPEPQDIFEGIDQEDDEAIEAAYEKWDSEAQGHLPLPLRRLRLVYKQRRLSDGGCCGYEEIDPINFKPSEMFSRFVPNVRWI